MLEMTLLMISVRSEYNSELERQAKQTAFDNINSEVKNLLKWDEEKFIS